MSVANFIPTANGASQINYLQEKITVKTGFIQLHVGRYNYLFIFGHIQLFKLVVWTILIKNFGHI